jgi:hypothetical protein
LEKPPPGAGLNTFICALPAVAISLAGIDPVNCVLLTSVVVRLEPFHCNADVLRKFVPVTVSVNAAPPTVALAGLRLVIEGAGLLIMKESADDMPPPGEGFTTITLAVPADVMSAAVIAAVTIVLLTNVVVRIEPFHCTVELLRRLVPFTVSVNAALPAIAEDGLKLDIDGTGLFTENV